MSAKGFVENVIRICFACNENYINLLLVAIHSIQKSNFHRKIYYYIYFNSSNEVHIKRIKELIENADNQIFFFDDQNIIPLLPQNFENIEYLSVEMYFRLLLPNILDLKRVLYLDVDVIVVDDILELFSLNIGKFGMAARPYDNNLKWVVDRNHSIGLPSHHRYFNSGVLLLDLEILRANNNFSKARELIFKEVKMHDQEALNIVFKDNYIPLNPKYNWTLHQQNVEFSPAIIHFTGKYKPTTFGFLHPYANVFNKLASEVLTSNYHKIDTKYYIYSRIKTFVLIFIYKGTGVIYKF